MDKNTLAHTTWECKYHVVFAPKYRRQIVYGKLKTEIGKILRTLCERKGVEIIEAEACPDHIHMLLNIPPKYGVSEFMGYLGKKFINDLRSVCQSEIQVWESTVLVSRILCNNGRKKQEGCGRIYPQSVTRR